MIDFQGLLEKYLPILKQYKIPLLLGFLGLLFFIYGLISLLGSSTSRSDSDIVFEPGSPSSIQTESAKEIFVDVEGYVIKPGLYKLKEGSRIRDALVASGGLAEKADRDWVSKNLNLAFKLSDGAKIYIPKVGEDAKNITGLPQSSSGQVAGIINSVGLVNINIASEEELDTLSGIGPVTAQKIINARPYGSIDDLLAKKVVSQSLFNKIKEKISVN